MEIYITLLVIGTLFAVGLVTDTIARRLNLPRVTLLILLGVLAGPAGFDLVPQQVERWHEFLSTTALTMVAFLLGGTLSRSQLKRNGRPIMTISLSVVISTIILVFAGLLFLGVPPAAALLFAGIATATDPAAIRDVITQTNSKGDFSDTLQGIVAIDDAWGLIAFSLLFVVANGLIGNGFDTVYEQGLWEFGGALFVGMIVGFPASYLTGRLREGEPVQIEALTIVFLCAGISMWLEVSFLLAGIVAGAIVVNFAGHHTRPFHEIKLIEWPFLILFFFLAGMSLRLDRWEEFLPIILAFLGLRVLGRMIGGWLGAKICDAPPVFQRWMGMALLPQAGVAIGMALIVSQKHPEMGDVILTVTICCTVIFEIFGPLATLVALRKARQSTDTNDGE